MRSIEKSVIANERVYSVRQNAFMWYATCVLHVVVVIGDARQKKSGSSDIHFGCPLSVFLLDIPLKTTLGMQTELMRSAARITLRLVSRMSDFCDYLAEVTAKNRLKAMRNGLPFHNNYSSNQQATNRSYYARARARYQIAAVRSVLRFWSFVCRHTPLKVQIEKIDVKAIECSCVLYGGNRAKPCTTMPILHARRIVRRQRNGIAVRPHNIFFIMHSICVFAAFHFIRAVEMPARTRLTRNNYRHKTGHADCLFEYIVHGAHKLSLNWWLFVAGEHDSDSSDMAYKCIDAFSGKR